jgi:hypothetical protein
LKLLEQTLIINHDDRERDIRDRKRTEPGLNQKNAVLFGLYSIYQKHSKIRIIIGEDSAPILQLAFFLLSYHPLIFNLREKSVPLDTPK